LKGINMLETNLRRLFIGAGICAVGAVTASVGCTSSPRKQPVVSTGAAGTSGNGTGAAGTTGNGTGAAGTTGAAGDTSTGAAGTTGAAGDTSTGAAGTTGAAGAAAGATGAAGAAGAGAAGSNATGAAGAGAAGTTGAAGAPPDNTLHIMDALPVAVTKYWYPSGWDGDGATVAAFGNNPAPIKIEMMTGATTGPCSKRVANAIGDCFKITYTPVMSDAGATHASVALIPNLPMSNMANFGDATMAPHVPAGATTISAEVAGDVGGETVQFNLWDANSGDLFTPTFPAGAGAQTWQKISVMIPAGYDQELSPFGWGSASTTPIVFYYDDIRIQ
jgi:hypothetical protein